MNRIVPVVLVGLLAACGGGGKDLAAEKVACSQAASDATSASHLFASDASTLGLDGAARDLTEGAGKVRGDVAALDSSDPIRVDALTFADAIDDLATMARTDPAHYDAPTRAVQVAGATLVNDCRPLVPDFH